MTDIADGMPPDRLAALQTEYEARIKPVYQIATEYEIDRRRLYTLAVAKGWKLRNPRRVDPSDLVERMMRLLERQTANLEKIMEKPGANEMAVLAKLTTTLDRLLVTRAAEDKKKPRPPRGSKIMADIRSKVAERLEQLRGV